MIGRIVEIAEDGRHLSLNRGFLVVSAEGREVGRVPLDDIAAFVANAHGLTYSNNLLLALAKRGASIVFCGANHQPAALLWSLDTHHEQAGRIMDQVAASRPLKKRLWQQLVRAKIRQQKATLDAVGQPSGGFDLLARKVRSGDPDNVEAQAARRYWPLLFGTEFKRDREAGGVNGLLNYAYAIVRSGIARAVAAAGLHPSLGIHHAGRQNAFCLVDDLMEPFRPAADLFVYRLMHKGITEVTSDAKRSLAGLLVTDMRSEYGVTPIVTCMERLAQSLAQALGGGEERLSLPEPQLPLER